MSNFQYRVPGNPADYHVGSYVLINGVGGTVVAAWRAPLDLVTCMVQIDPTRKDN